MLEWKRICCPIDFAAPSRAAMEQAADLAARFKAELTLLHVVPASSAAAGGEPIPFRDLVDARSKRHVEWLARWRASAEGLVGRPARSFLLSGDPASEILQHVVHEGYDLLVLGTHGRKGIARLLLGSVAEHVARRAPCSVLFIRDHRAVEAREDEEELALYR